MFIIIKQHILNTFLKERFMIRGQIPHYQYFCIYIIKFVKITPKI